jgi:hypothetical protein
MSNNDTSYIDAIETGMKSPVSSISASQAHTYCLVSAGSKDRPWICIIEGIDSKFGYKRSFISSRTTNLKAPFNKYQKYSWILKPHFVYEFKNFLGDFSSDEKFSGYFGVTKDGVKELTKDELRKALHLRVKGDKTPSKKSIKEAMEERIDGFAICKNYKKPKQKDFKEEDLFFSLGREEVRKKEETILSDEDIEREEAIQTEFKI